MGEFKPITTQEEFDAAIAERLKRERKTIEDKYKDYETLESENQSLKKQLSETQEVLEKNKTDSESFTKQIEELTGKISGYELKDLKTAVALKHGIPYELASRLVGTDEESLTNDAKSLSQMITQTEPIAPLKSVEPQQISGQDSAYMQLVDNLNLEGE
ncbi:capsid assembly scaffolding protein Gp46 family protein [Peptoniphilus asaccharolyticus]